MKNVLGLIILIAQDNNIPLRPFEEMEWPDGVDWAGLDKKAEQLHADEAEAFCNGEQEEAKAITEKYGLQDLDETLNLVFEGELHY